VNRIGVKGAGLCHVSCRRLILLNNKAKCSACHSTKEFVDPSGKTFAPLFTDFTYDNLGIPTTPLIYDLAGGSPPELGLGAFLETQGRDGFADQYGKFKVPTLRNVLQRGGPKRRTISTPCASAPP
jgi:cytochrome c peroxidase